MAKLFYNDTPLIGLDISQTGIKVMSINGDKWLVQGYGSLDLDPQKIQASLEGAEESYLAENIRTMLKNNVVGHLGSAHVAIGVPTSKAYSRTFTIPTSQEKAIAGAVEVEIEQYIPVPMSTLYVDYSIISRSKETITVVLSAVPRKIVDACVQATKQADLLPVIVEPSINSVTRVIEAVENGKLSTVIVDIGPASTDIAVLDGGFIRVSGGVGIGGNTFTLDIARKLNVPLEEAHQLKVMSGLNASPRQAKISAALNPSLDRVIHEIRKVIRYYNERLSEERKIEQVLIVGGGSNVPGIGDYFTNNLTMAARVASPWQKLDFGKLQTPSNQFLPRYITVAGLASIRKQEIWQ